MFGKMKLVGMVLLIAAISFAGTLPVHAAVIEEVVLSEDFNVDDDFGPFVPLGGTWVVSDGAARQTNVVGTAGGDTAKLFADNVGTDVTITTKFTINAHSAGGNRMGLYAHGSQNITGDWSFFAVTGFPSWQSISMLEDRIAWIVQAHYISPSSPWLITSGSSFYMKMTVSGQNVEGKIWPVGSPESSAVAISGTFGTTNLAEDGIGLYAAGADVSFDSIVVTKSIEVTDADLLILSKIADLEARVEDLEENGNGLSAEEIQAMINASLVPVNADIDTIINGYNGHTHDKGSGGRNTSTPNPQIQ